jgi:hypothetical protein
MTILTQAALPPPQRLTIADARRRIAALGLRMPSESAALIRESRDER